MEITNTNFFQLQLNQGDFAPKLLPACAAMLQTLQDRPPANRSDYPDQPGFKVPGLSEQTAAAVAGMAKTLRNQVRSVIASAPAGLTADVVADKLHRSVLSVRPRVSELHRQGEIRQTGARGKNESGMSASVWVLSPLLANETQGGEQ
jgi:hypothetical protein